jgi:hypothetical protein
MATSQTVADAEQDGSTLRSVVSLVLFLHLFCVAVVLASNLLRSPLQSQLVSLFAPYTQLLHFDPAFVPYHYTSGVPADDDVALIVRLYPDANTRIDEQVRLAEIDLTSSGANWLGDRRPMALSRILGLMAETQNDEAASEIAASVGTAVMREHNRGLPPERHAHWAVVECVRHLSPPLAGPLDEAEPTTVYVADVRLLEGGELSVTRREASRDVAPLRGADASPSPSGPPTAPNP